MRHKKLGLAFSDEVKKGSRVFGHFRGKKLTNVDWTESLIPNIEDQESENNVSPWRIAVFSVIFLVAFFGLFLRLFHLQVVTAKENKQLADSNRVRIKVIHAPRGVIYDRNGKILAENNPGFRLKKEFINRDDALEMEAKNDPRYYSLEIDAIRSYPLGAITSHVVGYVGQITEEEMKDPRYKNYQLGDKVGRAGIEQMYENVLRGTDGAEIIEIDASGKKLRTLRTIEPTPGNNVFLSLDSDLQKVVYKTLETAAIKSESCCGAAVAENPKTGEVLALVSLPAFDGNAFTDPKRYPEVQKYFEDQNAPMLNRVISGTYPPGSTFKITSALAGLSSGKITKSTLIEDTGVLKIDIWSFANWYFTQYGKTEGPVDLVKALQRSNDIYFYRVGDMVGADALGKTAKLLGMGKKLGIDLPGEVDGLIPNQAWKKKNIGEDWYPGDNLHMAIGQGYLLTTPLQILAQTSYVAADGFLIQPHLVTKIVNSEGATVKEIKYEPIVKNVVKKEDLEAVKLGLEAVPKDGGTAWPFFTFKIPTAGKTGTAEIGDPKGKTHAWYTGYAPVDNPEILATVLIEKGGEGSSQAAPIVKDIFTWYFNPDKSNIKSLDGGPISTESARLLGE